MYPNLMQMLVNTPRVAMSRFVNIKTCIGYIPTDLLAEA